MQKTIERREAQEEGNAETRELMYAMLNGDTYTSLQAISALGAMGAPAVEPLVRAALPSTAMLDRGDGVARAGTSRGASSSGVVP